MFAFTRLARAPTRLVACGALALAMWSAMGARDAAAEAILSVSIDHAKIAKVPEGTKTLVIGSPIVADVTLLHGSNAVVVTGKGYGETNFVALDAAGDVLEERIIRVEPTSSVLVVQRGMSRESYSCAPKCMPAIELGDSTDFGTDVPPADQIKKRNELASPSAASQQIH